jgi:hypothetical protein
VREEDLVEDLDRQSGRMVFFFVAVFVLYLDGYFYVMHASGFVYLHT